MKAKILGAALLASLDEILAVFILLLLLPHLGIMVPPLYLVAALLGLAVLSYIIYLLVKPVIVRSPMVGAEALIGLKGTALTRLEPEGLIMLEGERWKAQAVGGTIEKNEKVVVVGVEGLTLKVKRFQPDSGIL